MSLESRVGASLERVTPSAQTVRRLLAGAARHIADAKSPTISAETRFASAYTAIRMMADAGLNALGYRTLAAGLGIITRQTRVAISIQAMCAWPIPGPGSASVGWRTDDRQSSP